MDRALKAEEDLLASQSPLYPSPVPVRPQQVQEEEEEYYYTVGTLGLKTAWESLPGVSFIPSKTLGVLWCLGVVAECNVILRDHRDLDCSASSNFQHMPPPHAP